MSSLNMTGGDAPSPGRGGAEASPSQPSFVERVRRRESVVGTFVSSPDAVLAEMLAGAFDFVVIDMEHSAISVRDVQLVAIAVRAAGAAALVRPPSSRADCIGALLDGDVDGIVAPQIDSAAAAGDLVRRLRYPPLGSRGFAVRRAGRYGRDTDSWRRADEEVLCVVQIETAGALEELSELAALPGVDALLVGPSDLSFALGDPLNSTSPKIQAAIERVQHAASEAGIVAAFANNLPPENLHRLIDGRSTMVMQYSDLGMYSRAVDDMAKRVHSALRDGFEKLPDRD
jgi:2-keto-3-deoxy-L-rhamnonate aldolase RhmA